MSNKFKLEFTLKQHTPIIHFQSEQKGATLRASELKPKLDKFLLQQKPELPKKKNANGSLSLDYKVKIIAYNLQEENIEKKNPKNGKDIPDPLFFGNMGDGKKKKFVTAEKLIVEFKSFNEAILKAIETYFEAFLANTNFGTRQSKGYGSFFIQEKEFDKKLIQHKAYSFQTNNWKTDIKLLYSFLRAGINTANFGGIYAKAAIFSYAKSKGWTWDKKAIKQKYFNSILEEHQKKYPQANNCVNNKSENKYLVRDLFGLSSEQSWKSYNTTISKDEIEGNIDRFKSPIVFKVVDNTVYFWADKSVEFMLNKSFIIKSNNRGNLKLETPSRFDFDDFFSYVFNINLSSYIDTKFHDTKDYNSLSRIFNSIKDNK